MNFRREENSEEEEMDDMPLPVLRESAREGIPVDPRNESFKPLTEEEEETNRAIERDRERHRLQLQKIAGATTIHQLEALSKDQEQEEEEKKTIQVDEATISIEKTVKCNTGDIVMILPPDDSVKETKQRFWIASIQTVGSDYTANSHRPLREQVQPDQYKVCYFE